MKPKQDIQTVVFDLDGTLYDKRGLARRMMRALWWCLPLLAAERLARKRLHGKLYNSEDEFYLAFFRQMARGHWWSARLAGRWYDEVFMPTMVRLIGQHYAPRKDVMEMVADFHRRNIPMAVYSDYGNAWNKLKALQIAPQQFKLVTDAPALGGLKPNEVCARALLQMLNAKPETTLFVGDRDDKDGATARAVGAQFMQV